MSIDRAKMEELCDRLQFGDLFSTEVMDLRFEAATGLADLLDERERLRTACQNFVDKCDRGEAYSKRSYAEMKDALGLTP